MTNVEINALFRAGLPLNSALNKAREDEAISFMLYSKYYLAYHQNTEGVQYWVSIDGKSVLSTKQLYEKFKKENEQNNS